MRYYSLLLFNLTLSFATIAQPKISSLSSGEWLKMIEGNAIKRPGKPHSFLNAKHGYALYFSKAGSTNVPYLVYVPESYNPTHALPAVVFLHGAILALDSFQYKNPAIADEPVFAVADTFNTIVIFPFARQDFRWSGQPGVFENIICIIDETEEYYNIDKKRIYIGGISMGGNATYWFINNKAEIFAGFYTFSAMPQPGTKYSNITSTKPLYSVNAKDDPVFQYTKVEAAWQQHKNETPGWHFSSVETGGHRFIYKKDGEQYIKSLIGNLLFKNN